jgi:hypothetical protein
MKLFRVLRNNGDIATITKIESDTITRAEGTPEEFQAALPAGVVVEVPDNMPANMATLAASRVRHLRTIGNLNQIRADLQNGNLEKADNSLRDYVAAYVADFTSSIKAGKG